jgi:kynurenine formamidase
MRYIDLSHPIYDHMSVYPGDSPTVLKDERNMEQDGYCIWQLSSSMHAGTHVDCPMHLVNSATFIGEYPLESFMGKASLLDASGQDIIAMKNEYYEKVREGEILLIYTGFDKYYGTKEYYESHPVITEDMAKFLVERRIKLVGIDMPSPDCKPYKAHKILLEGGIFILENLTGLDKLLHEEDIEMFAQPLKLAAEASLVRAVARVGKDS